MALVNTHSYVHQVIDWRKLEQATGGIYRLVASRPYSDRKGVLPDGYTLTLTVLQDNFDYGVDKNGVPRENNQYQNFDVTVLSRKAPLKKGDMVRLVDFDAEHSYYIDFNLILRFKGYEVVQQNGGKNNG